MSMDYKITRIYIVTDANSKLDARDKLKEDADQDGLSAPGSVGAPPTESPAPSTPDSGTNDTEGKAVPVCPGPAAPGTARCHSQVLVR